MSVKIYPEWMKSIDEGKLSIEQISHVLHIMSMWNIAVIGSETGAGHGKDYFGGKVPEYETRGGIRNQMIADMQHSWLLRRMLTTEKEPITVDDPRDSLETKDKDKVYLG
jgi:hypothetical protein